MCLALLATEQAELKGEDQGKKPGREGIKSLKETETKVVIEVD